MKPFYMIFGSWYNQIHSVERALLSETPPETAPMVDRTQTGRRIVSGLIEDDQEIEVLPENMEAGKPYRVQFWDYFFWRTFQFVWKVQDSETMSAVLAWCAEVNKKKFG